jgi:hypothetical protein
MSDSLFDFDLNLEPAIADEPPPESPSPLEKWADEQLSKLPVSGPLFFDIETGGRPEEELRALYHEKTLEKFSATADKRWKPETVAAKFEEYKVTAWQEFVDRAALSPTTGRVLLIGLLNGKFKPLGDGEGEAETIIRFWDWVDFAIGTKRRIIGHNSAAFDLPFLVTRSWLLGVPVPREIRQGRYWNPLFVDTMEAWFFGERNKYIKLNALGQLFNVGQKTEGFDGKDFAKFWFGTPEEHQQAIDYNETDLRLTAAIAAKMGLV